jgi:hypothetical protein
LNLDSGKPCRFPSEFTAHYTVKPDVWAAYAKLPDSSRHVGYSRGAA